MLLLVRNVMNHVVLINQLRGRAGRQGDPGVTQFYLSLEDELMRRFGSDKMKATMERFGMDDSTPIQSRMVSRSVESAQKRVEGNNFDSRKRLLEYDDVLRQQREVIYTDRNAVLEQENIRPLLENMLRNVIERAVVNYTRRDEDEGIEEISTEGLANFVEANLLPKGWLTAADFEGKTSEEIELLIKDEVIQRYDEKEEEMSEEQMREFEKVILLRAIDTKWTEHIDAMDQLRQGIHLRAYGQNDPLAEYQAEGFYMFDTMMQAIEEDAAKYVMKAEIYRNLERQEVAKGQAVNPKGGEAPKKQPIRKKKIGRNEPCPCGSGKKYKNCHGKE